MADETAYLQQVRAEHYDLEQLVRQIEEAFGSARIQGWPPTSAPRLTELLTELNDQIQRHFAQEEVGGYMEEALSLAPRFSGQAQALLKQHAELSQAVRELQARAKAEVLAWNSLHADLLTLLKKLKAHEAGENRIIEAAFNEDLGLAD
ncbi:MAG: hemerythrin domain-containing protein [Pirellulales bacterium]|nr:hemerythrin domain-containing protein [Pirellulales bacterium]